MCYMSITDILQMQKYDIFFINYPFLYKKKTQFNSKFLLSALNIKHFCNFAKQYSFNK